MNKLTVALLDGAARKDSSSRRLLYQVAQSLSSAGATPLIFDQSTHPLPIYDDSDSGEQHPHVQALFEAVRRAEVVVLCSPEYHGGMSGAIKNALDWLSNTPKENGLKGKLVGLVGGGGGLANSGANIQMMMSVRALHAWLMPDVILSIPQIWDAFKEDGTLGSPEYAERLEIFVKRLVRYGQIFRAHRAEFLEAA